MKNGATRADEFIGDANDFGTIFRAPAPLIAAQFYNAAVYFRAGAAAATERRADDARDALVFF